MRRSVFVVAALALLAGCNSVSEKPYQMVQVVTPDLAGAECSLKSKNAQYRLTTPGTIMIDRSPENLYVTCEKGNYKTGSLMVESKIHMGNSVWNVVNGIVPGTAWDIANNSIYDYPDVITVPMEFDEAAYNDVNNDYKQEVVPLQKKARPLDTFKPDTAAEKPADTTFDKALHK